MLPTLTLRRGGRELSGLGLGLGIGEEGAGIDAPHAASVEAEDTIRSLKPLIFFSYPHSANLTCSQTRLQCPSRPSIRYGNWSPSRQVT